MTAVSFCYWLQGFFELDATGAKRASSEMTHQQVEAIKRHLNLVFLHDIDPREPGDSKVSQAAHDGKPFTVSTDKDFLVRC